MINYLLITKYASTSAQQSVVIVSYLFLSDELKTYAGCPEKNVICPISSLFICPSVFARFNANTSMLSVTVIVIKHIQER